MFPGQNSSRQVTPPYQGGWGYGGIAAFASPHVMPWAQVPPKCADKTFSFSRLLRPASPTHRRTVEDGASVKRPVARRSRLPATAGLSQTANGNAPDAPAPRERRVRCRRDISI